nr:MAG TPA: hypothetical protein [Caudoviricetes sp.]
MGLSAKIAFGITSDTRGRRKRNTSNTIRRTRNTSRRNTRNGCENKKSERFGEERAEMAEIDMTKPQPCNMFDVADGEAWAKELGKHMYDVVRDAIYMEQFFDCIERADEEALAEKLTEIIKVCTSWIAALGYDEAKRGELQRRVNEKYKERGYF